MNSFFRREELHAKNRPKTDTKTDAIFAIEIVLLSTWKTNCSLNRQATFAYFNFDFRTRVPTQHQPAIVIERLSFRVLAKHPRFAEPRIKMLLYHTIPIN